MTILKRVATELKKIKAQGSGVPAGLSVVLGVKESEAVELEATTEFYVNQMQGNENLCGLPIVRINQPTYFAVEVHSKA